MDLALIKSFKIIMDKLSNIDLTLQDVNDKELEGILLSFSARALLLMDKVGVIKIKEGETNVSN